VPPLPAGPAVRAARPGDVARVKEIAAAAYARYIPRIGRPPAPMMADYDGAIGRREVWVAVRAGRIVGFVVLVRRADHLLLENVAADPADQGTGVGARLLAFAEEQAGAAGLVEIRLYTHVTMTENQAYYPRHGYVETHRENDEGFDRVFFRKRLDRAG
jgi:ribosomal protein S18 acetylase RimI-like enzyme